MAKKINPTWEGKTSFLPGMPDDLSQLPTLHYQAIEGRVFTLMRWPNESVAHGEIPLTQLEDLVGKGMIEEGWYDAAGEYLGETLPESL
ncbi:MAG: hypothetical protein M3Q42_08325 [Pseudomonadota bacterium]|nr:hypothetical protein [Pseudomonadota bacterium]